MLVIRAGIHKMLLRIANREDSDQTASEVWVCTVFLSLFGRQLDVKILQYSEINTAQDERAGYFSA